MTTNSELVLGYLKSHYGSDFSKKEIADALGITVPAVTGTINALTKKGYAKMTHEDVIELEPATDTRKAKTKTVKYHTLTESGLAYDPVAEQAEKDREKAAEKARREAEKEARKAAREA